MEKSTGYTIMWVFLLIFIGWPVAYFCVQDVTRFLEKLMTWPREIGRAMIDGQTTFPKPY
eukprot:scaffold361419_cov50-Attheya_sp.AAC.1